MTVFNTPPASQVRSCQGAPRASSHGRSLIEGLAALLILLVLLGGSLHWMRDVTQRHATEAVAALLETDLRHARSQALATDRVVRFELTSRPDGSSCYVTHTGAAGACQCDSGAVASCQPGVQLIRVAEQSLRQQVRIAHSGRALSFDPGKGTVTPTATFRVQGADGGEIRQIVNIMGRVRSCSNDRLAGLGPCS